MTTTNPRQQLHYIITHYGRSICDDPKRCEALLKDLCPQHKLEVNLLMGALREGIAKELLKPNQFLPVENIFRLMVQKLDENLGIAEHHAQWAVESWAFALGVKFNTASNAHSPKNGVGLAQIATIPTNHAATLQQIKQPQVQNHASQAMIDQFKGWQKIGLQDEVLAVDAPQWAAVIDEKTQLMWTINPSKVASFPNPNKKMTWDAAIALADYVNAQGWCGFNDWRLPTINELKTLLTETKQSSLYIREDIFNDINDTVYRVWSFSTHADNSSQAWLVGFLSSSSYCYLKSDYNYVRFVRLSSHQSSVVKPVEVIASSPQYPIAKTVINRFKGWQKIGINGEKLAIDALRWGAIIDGKNKLMWAVNPSKISEFPNPNKSMTWDEAQVWANKFHKKSWFNFKKEEVWCGFNDWRLPTIEELKTLLTETKQTSLYICEDFFNDIKTKNYWLWSSSSMANGSNYAWFVDFDEGYDGSNVKSGSGYVRLVRSVQ